MKKSLYILFLVATIVVLATACGKGDADDDKKKDKIKVNTTVYPLKSFTEQIGGKHVSVKSIYPAGTDLHDYEPTQKDIINTNKSDLFIYTGDNLDPVSKKIAKTIKDKDKKLSLEEKLDMSQLLTDQHHHEGEESEHEHHHHHHGGYDPHVWLDTKFDQTFAKEIKDELVKKDPKHKAYYEKNYKKLNKDLEKIDSKMKETVKGKEGSTIFISHESIGYLAERYGFVQKGVQNMNAEDPSQKDLTKIVKEIKSSGAKYILYEDNVSHKVTDTIRKETSAKPLKFYNMESMTKEQTKDDNISFQSLMNNNIKQIGKALNPKVKTTTSDNDEKHEKAISDGYFKDNQIKDRALSDYNGNWKSVYPLLKDGTLDAVMKHKAKEDDSMSEKEYKDYYEKGYKTNVDNIKIADNVITFTKNGKTVEGQYDYDGKEVLKYDKGNRGVRFTFKLKGESNQDLPKYVQFSDHNIAPKKAAHFHIFMGNDKQKLLKEVDNWPTYYPANQKDDEVKEDMLAH
ncbi:zinc ABC transporter substrate-binding lipoprotein AdcA [Staphylococcus sp. ACRSN]|uniref:zinc ABC transporter substrate-binding lipoprotein AdcA n=1 Tax=Staphylococcus sp. ACRSN TaxID=2918214 RepID=UPI001EF33672|nr:zinc ABC transporter substrate-binding lipoprotein AdcA [Staphylococcus sp. ACRSN]MCG7338131.1 zinc ABC transporter substrate-binding lipoprotein AdcA [Staphylococcus sp. ACRSN]